MAAASKKGTAQDVLPVSEAAQLEQFGRMFLSIPLAEDDDGTGIILGILGANSPLDLNVGGKLLGSKDIVGKEIVVRSIERRESQIEDSDSEYYLIVKGTEGPHQKPITFGTDSKAVIAVLTKLYTHGWLPALVKVTEGNRSKRGFVPLNLEVITVPGYSE